MAMSEDEVAYAAEARMLTDYVNKLAGKIVQAQVLSGIPSPLFLRWEDRVRAIVNAIADYPEIALSIVARNRGLINEIEVLIKGLSDPKNIDFEQMDMGMSKLVSEEMLVKAEAKARSIATSVKDQLRNEISTELSLFSQEARRLLDEQKQIHGSAAQMLQQVGERGASKNFEFDSAAEQSAIKRWHIGASLGFLGWVVLLSAMLRLGNEVSLSWPYLVRQVTLSLPFVLWIGFCVRNASRHHLAKREYFRLSFQTNSLGPLTSGLSPEAQEAIRLIIIPQIYAQPATLDQASASDSHDEARSLVAILKRMLDK